MDYDILHHKKEQLAKICNRIPLETLESYEKVSTWNMRTTPPPLKEIP